MEPLFTVPLQKQQLSFQALTQALRELVTNSKIFFNRQPRTQGFI